MSEEKVREIFEILWAAKKGDADNLFSLAYIDEMRVDLKELYDLSTLSLDLFAKEVGIGKNSQVLTDFFRKRRRSSPKTLLRIKKFIFNKKVEKYSNT